MHWLMNQGFFKLTTTSKLLKGCFLLRMISSLRYSSLFINLVDPLIILRSDTMISLVSITFWLAYGRFTWSIVFSFTDVGRSLSKGKQLNTDENVPESETNPPKSPPTIIFLSLYLFFNRRSKFLTYFWICSGWTPSLRPMLRRICLFVVKTQKLSIIYFSSSSIISYDLFPNKVFLATIRSFLLCW